MDGDLTEQDPIILHNGREENNPDENSTDDNEASAMNNVTVYPTDDNEVSQEITAFDSNHFPVADNVPHDQDALINAARLGRSWSNESSGSSASALSVCKTCKHLRSRFLSRETADFWDKVDSGGNNCHSKFWIKFIEKLNEEFPLEDGLKRNRTVFLLKTILGVKKRDDAEVKLADLLDVVRFFGPIKPDSDGRCLLIQHLQEILKSSVSKGKENKKVSWFAGEMSRDKANGFLQSQSDNTYLVRMSESKAESGSFVVSVKNENGCHHFEIEGDPLKSANSPTLNCHLRVMGRNYKTLPAAIEDLKYNSLYDEENDEDIMCTRICPNLPFNSVITSYK